MAVGAPMMHVRKAIAIALTGFSVTVAIGPASASMIAAPITNAIAQLQEWNLISFDNYTPSNEVEGRVFVGGNLNVAQGTQFNFRGTTVSANGTGAVTVVGNASGNKIDFRAGDLVVGGSESANTLEANNSGSVYVGTTDSSVNHNNMTISQGLASSVGNFTSTLQNQKSALVNSLTGLSSNLKALAATGTVNTADNALKFTASTGLNVLSLTVDQINQYSQNYIDIISPNGSTTVINVSGSGTINRNFNSESSAKNIIWNFYDATSLTLGNWQGTVLAVGADFVKDQSGAINGTVVARNASNYAEVHSYAFQGDLSSVGGGVSATPEPATWAMLILGFGLIGMALRQRGHAAPSYPGFA
jgi:choice-of-anchor A domain-containing protein